jgi:gamma-butyrobetaine dioxygenase
MQDSFLGLAAGAGIVPERTSDPAEARTLLRRDGAVVLTGTGLAAPEAVDVARTVFAGELRAVPEAAEVRAGGVKDLERVPNRPSPEQALDVHTDGFAYGDAYPDHFLLLCAESSRVGGDSFLVDGYALLDGLGQLDAELARAMETVAIDQTETGMHSSLSPLVGRAEGGRRMVRRCPFQRPRPDTADPEADQAMIDVWDELCRRAGAVAPRFKLQPGETLVVDNYRVMHGRDPYEDVERLMWRVWIWTTSALAVPGGMLASDTRYASANG